MLCVTAPCVLRRQTLCAIWAPCRQLAGSMPLAPAALDAVPKVSKRLADEPISDEEVHDECLLPTLNEQSLAEAARWAKEAISLLAPVAPTALLHDATLNMSTHFSGIGAPEIASRFLNSALCHAGLRDSDLLVSKYCLEV